MFYEIRVDGRVDPAQLADVATVSAAPQPAATVLICDITDAAALTGIIALLSDRGIVVRDVHRVAKSAAGTAALPAGAPRPADATGGNNDVI